jgi:type I restriction enzyme R subunit
MWLTGFDSLPLPTLYLDRPVRGAALMEALARVNRPFRSKQDCLLVGDVPHRWYCWPTPQPTSWPSSR